jgi:hypothetical protein
MTKATDGEGATPRPTGKNAEQDAELAALTATVKAQADAMAAMEERMNAMLAAQQQPAPSASKPAALTLNNDEAAKAVVAARSDKPKTYRALMDGTDITQGFIRAGTVFSTTQPQGSWMEEAE